MGEPWALWRTNLVIINIIIICVWSNCLALRTSNDKTQATHLRLMTKAGESEALPRRGTGIRENDIAAIFRGVAYGAPTQGRPNITTPSSFILQPGEHTTSSSSLTYTTIVSGELIGRAFSTSAPVANPAVGQNPSVNGYVSNTPAADRDKQGFHEDGSGKRNGSLQEHGNSAIYALATFSPAPNIRETDYHVSGDSKNQTAGVGIKDLSGDGVSITDNRDSPDLRLSLGLVWWVQVYTSVSLFTLLAIVTLCLMARFAIATHLLPRPHYLALHALIFCTAFLRSFHTLNDAHTLKYVLPVTLLTTVEESVWPCLTAALAVVLVAVLRAWRYPRHPHLALALALITTVHLITLPAAHLTAALLKDEEDLAIKTTTRAVTAAWGGAVGIGGMWAVWRESKDYSSQLTDVRAGNNQENYPNVAHPARLVFAATLTQLLLAGLHLYILLVPISPEGQIWVWWCCVSVSRGLELIVGSTLVSAAALTLDGPNQCCMFRSCCQKRTVEIVHPTEIKMIHPMGVYTLQPARPKNEHAQTIAALSLNNAHKEKRNHSSLDYVTSDFQLVWNHNRQRPLTGSHTTQRLIGDDIPRAHILPIAPRNVMEPFVSSNAFSTIPRNRMYASPPSCLQFEDEDMKNSQEQGMNYASKSSTMLSESSGSSKLYASPQIPLRTSRSWDELSTGHVYEDPLKTKPSSVDEGLSDLSDMNSENINELFLRETCSPVLLRPKKRSRRRHNTACYLNARHFTTHQPSTHTSSATHSAQLISQTSKSSDHMSMTRQNSNQQSVSHSSSSQKSTGEYPTNPLSEIAAPAPFHSNAQNTSTLHRTSLHHSSGHTTATRHVQTGVSRSKVKSKPDHHEGY